MKLAYRTAALAMAGAALVSTAATAAPQTSSRVWVAGGLKKGDPSLSYSTPDSDDIGIVLSCKRGQGSVKIFISETSDKFKPNGTATGVLSVGSAKLSFSASFTPNEEAGIPSLEGSAPLKNELFSQLKGSGKLQISIDEWSDSFPLKGIDEQAAKFIAACSK
jgi:hypothetical protein